MNLPTKEECRHLIQVTFRMPENVVEHSVQVNRIAVFLARKLKAKGEGVNIELVDRASILHDILKVIEITDFSFSVAYGGKPVMTITKKDRDRWDELKERYGGMSHEEAAYVVLKEKYPEVAGVIRKHKYSSILDDGLETWEEKLVSYADKRVKHSEIVSLKERFEDGHKRYSHMYPDWKIDKEKADIIDAKFFELEKEIFNNMDFGPDDIVKEIEKEENLAKQLLERKDG